MFELEGYTMPDFPVRDEGQYPIAMVSLDSSGGCAYLTFADKAGYIIKLIAGDVWTGNAYTLGLTPEDTYDESKVIYEQSYVVMLDEAYKDALELLYPGITTTAWLRYTPPSTQTPSGGYYSLAMNYGPQWTNTDLYDEDGNLFLSAAGKKFPLREWLSWRIYGLCSRPLPMSQKQDVLDNEWPIEWTSTVVANNATKGVSDGYTFVKVSHLTPTADTLSQSTLIVEALSDDAQDVVLSSQGQFGYGEDYLDVGISSAIFFVTFNALVQVAFLLYICVVHIPNESFTETGIYYCLVKEKNAEMVGPSAAPFRFRLSKETEVS